MESKPLTKAQLQEILDDRDYTRLDAGLVRTIIEQAMKAATE